MLPSQTSALRPFPENKPRSGYDGAKRKKGSKLHLAADTLDNLLGFHVMPTNVDDCAEVGRLTHPVQGITSDSADIAFVDQGYNSPDAVSAAEPNAIEWIVVKLPG